MQGAGLLGLQSSVRPLAVPACVTAHSKAWPGALREEGCCKDSVPLFLLLLLCFLSCEVVWGGFLWSLEPVTSVSDL